MEIKDKKRIENLIANHLSSIYGPDEGEKK